jgi:hypothetical protein
MLFKVNTRTAMSLPALERAALKFIYRGLRVFKADDGKMIKVKEPSQAEIANMFDSMQHWVNHFKLEKMKREDTAFKLDILNNPSYKLAEDSEEYKLFRLLDLLKRNENGELDYQKRTLELHGIDYRLFHRMPEMYVGKDAALRQHEANEEFKKLCREKPEENLPDEDYR